MPTGLVRSQQFAAVGNGILLTCTNSSSNVAFPTIGTGAMATDCLIVNTGTVAAFVVFGDTAPTAAIPTNGVPANGICIPAGAIMILDKGKFAFVAGITASGTALLYVYQGQGA